MTLLAWDYVAPGSIHEMTWNFARDFAAPSSHIYRFLFATSLCDILFGIPAPSTTNRDVRLASRRMVLVCHRDFRLEIATWIIRRNMRCSPRWHPEIFLSSCILFVQLLSLRWSWFINSKLCVNCDDTKQQRAKKLPRENYFRFARV